jgi:hypothetical protein
MGSASKARYWTNITLPIPDGSEAAIAAPSLITQEMSATSDPLKYPYTVTGQTARRF